MLNDSRIPKLSEVSFDGALTWFADMQTKGLLFHPEDDPGSIYQIHDNQKAFSETEVAELRFVLGEIESRIGHDKMTEAAYPVFMTALGIRLDA